MLGVARAARPAGPINWPALFQHLASELRQLRVLCGLSQQQVADAAGVSQGAVSRLESGRFRQFPVTTVAAILVALVRATEAVEPAIPSHLLPPLAVVRDLLPALVVVPAVPLDRELAELLRLYHQVPRARRPIVLAVLRPLAAHLLE